MPELFGISGHVVEHHISDTRFPHWASRSETTNRGSGEWSDQIFRGTMRS